MNLGKVPALLQAFFPGAPQSASSVALLPSESSLAVNLAQVTPLTPPRPLKISLTVSFAGARLGTGR